MCVVSGLHENPAVNTLEKHLCTVLAPGVFFEPEISFKKKKKKKSLAILFLAVSILGNNARGTSLVTGTAHRKINLYVPVSLHGNLHANKKNEKKKNSFPLNAHTHLIHRDFSVFWGFF